MQFYTSLWRVSWWGVCAAWVEAHKALFPGNAVLRQQVLPESIGLMFFPP